MFQKFWALKYQEGRSIWRNTCFLIAGASWHAMVANQNYCHHVLSIHVAKIKSRGGFMCAMWDIDLELWWISHALNPRGCLILFPWRAGKMQHEKICFPKELTSLQTSELLMLLWILFCHNLWGETVTSNRRYCPPQTLNCTSYFSSSPVWDAMCAEASGRLLPG